VTLIRVILKAILCLSLMTTRKTGERPHVVAVLLLLDYEVRTALQHQQPEETNPFSSHHDHRKLPFAICNSHSWLHYSRTLTSASLVEKCSVNFLANRSPRLLLIPQPYPGSDFCLGQNTNRLPHQEAHIGEDREPLSGFKIPRVSNVNHSCSCAPSTGPTEF